MKKNEKIVMLVYTSVPNDLMQGYEDYISVFTDIAEGYAYLTRVDWYVESKQYAFVLESTLKDYSKTQVMLKTQKDYYKTQVLLKALWNKIHK